MAISGHRKGKNMINKIHELSTFDDQTFEVECDQCGGLAEYTVDNWSELMQEMGNDGWVSRKKGEEWLHYCEDCKQ